MGADYYQNTEDMAENDAKGIPNIGVGKFCYIENAILDKNCHIGNNVKLSVANIYQMEISKPFYKRRNNRGEKRCHHKRWNNDTIEFFF